MPFIEDIKDEARKDKKRIILPEATEVRILKATEKIGKEGFAQVILIGKKEEILKVAKENEIDISSAEIIDPDECDKTELYTNKLFGLRQRKGLTEKGAMELMKYPIYFGMMMVKEGDADGLVAGAIHSTADVLRPALQIIKTEPGTKIVSSFSLMVVPDCAYGEKGVFAFSDTGINQNPNSEELSEIAISTAKSFECLLGKEAKVAMLSYSTYGSAKADEVSKVSDAMNIVKEKEPGLDIDGEMQLDAAIITSVGEIKAPGSKVAGKANVLIFPNLDSGNIGYKLVERLAKAEAYGPICQGLAKPVNDLSRGCKADDIVGVVAITAVQAQRAEQAQ
ncbi:MAG: phosphate acetyltransferase [Oscillospiraceae bacterium]|nr:phosphate acetyltransferase [Oscillospiraceae bacterium]